MKYERLKLYEIGEFHRKINQLINWIFVHNIKNIKSRYNAQMLGSKISYINTHGCFMNTLNPFFREKKCEMGSKENLVYNSECRLNTLVQLVKTGV